MSHGWVNLERRRQVRPPANPLQARRVPRSQIGNIRLTLAEYCQRRGWLNWKGTPNRAQLQRVTGVSDDALFYMLRYPELVDRIHFSTLARLCHTLQCQPGDLLAYVRTEDAETPLSEQYKADPEAGLDP